MYVNYHGLRKREAYRCKINILEFYNDFLFSIYFFCLYPVLFGKAPTSVKYFMAYKDKKKQTRSISFHDNCLETLNYDCLIHACECMFKVSKQPGCFYSLLCLCVRPSVADFLFYVFVCIVVFQSWGALCTVCPYFLIHLECKGLFFYSLFVPYSLFLSFLILNLTCLFIIFIFLYLFNSLCLSL